MDFSSVSIFSDPKNCSKTSRVNPMEEVSNIYQSDSRRRSIFREKFCSNRRSQKLVIEETHAKNDENASAVILDQNTRFTHGFNNYNTNIRVSDEKMYKFAIASRPLKGGTFGRVIPILSNHFGLTNPSNSTVFQYDVVINPGTNSSNLNRRIVMKALQSTPRLKETSAFAVFDGVSKIYSKEKLEYDMFDTSSSFYVLKADQFEVRVEPSGKIQLSRIDEKLATQTAKVFEAVLQSISALHNVALSRFFFFLKFEDSLELERRSLDLGWGNIDLGSAREARFGFHQSVNLGQNDFFLNVDVSRRTFYKQIGVLDFLAEVLGFNMKALTDGRQLTQKHLRQFSEEIVGLKVETTHCGGPRTYKVTGVEATPVKNLNLLLSGELSSDGNVVPVTEYYKSRYGIDLKFLHLPCLEVFF
ncbi:unnamed protein product [Caenorhabditis auriculariae]|uniref:PAZ domain-containing protein n=1 Tax=Caenorhabditis auriculariae TaxID=2777116 RepID=A0A8S1GS34_9PELO|nr:unnamed protein product [Caenorhabditis auriculariae]